MKTIFAFVLNIVKINLPELLYSHINGRFNFNCFADLGMTMHNN